MAEMNAKKITDNRRVALNLSLFTLTETTPVKSPSSGNKSPKNFEEPNGVVGLGILAAMSSSNSKNDYNFHDQFIKRTAVIAVPKSSNPIPILSKKNCTFPLSPKNKTNLTTGDSNANMEKRPSVEDMELCEEYTCVISRCGDNQIKKIEYFDDGAFLENKNFVIGDSVKITANTSAVGSSGGETEAFQMADFLSSCFLCRKKLQGLDIFMYRGEKAFCSAECRCKQIALEEHKEKCTSGARKPHEYPASPCSSTMQFFAGVAAA